MAMASLHDRSYCPEDRVLYITNGFIEYYHTKRGVTFKMKSRTCSLNRPNPVYKVTFAGKPFPINVAFIKEAGLHNLLDISALQ
jgi:hypothetical protein